MAALEEEEEEEEEERERERELIMSTSRLLVLNDIQNMTVVIFVSSTRDDQNGILQSDCSKRQIKLKLILLTTTFRNCIGKPPSISAEKKKR